MLTNNPMGAVCAKEFEKIVGVGKYLIFIKLQNIFQKLRKRDVKAKQTHDES